jgi:acetolactate synthase-1/2/3 large subunit
MQRRAADLLVDCLAAHGTDRIFAVPGESYLSVLDALHDRNAIDTVVCRHEGGAAFMAVADAKITGRPGIAFVSRGPGATNASIGVHVAEQEAVGLLLFIGQVPRHEIGRRAFQEVDYAQMFSGMAKSVAVVHDAERLAEVVARAYAVAAAPTPGPVVVVLPEDMLEDKTASAVVGPLPVPRGTRPDDGDIREIVRLIAKAERPLLIAGGGVGSERGRAALVAASEAHGLPVAPSFKRQEIFPNTHPHYAGHLGFKLPTALVDAYRAADLLIAVGTRLGEVTTQGYTFPRAPAPEQPLVHVTDDPTHIGRVFQTAKGLIADPVAFLEALAGRPSITPERRREWIRRLGAVHTAARIWRPPADGLLDMGPVAAALARRLPDDAVLITDAGNFSGWLHRHFAFSGRHLLIGSVGGAMGMGMPGAVAAGLRLKDRVVVTWIGDGGMLMTGSELATAVQHGAAVKVFVSNNGSYGTIRLHQERAFRGRVSGTRLTNPDFARWAESFGARGLTIRSIAEADNVVAAALAEPGPVVVDVLTSVEHIAPGLTLGEIR